MATLLDDPIVDRLKNVTAAYRDATETWETHRDKWQEAVTDAVDKGLGVPAVAEIAGVTRARVFAIVARVYARRA